MAKKKKINSDIIDSTDSNNLGLHPEVIDQPITETLESNYMPYAMSVIISRAIPEIDGFKPSHRKLLYTMYKMGLLTGQRQKSANIVGRTMQLNPHGDAAIYDTMVRLSTGHEALLVPFVDSKGNFGKVYSRDMSYAASRYTEAKLSQICAEVFKDIDKDTVDFTDSYDGTQKEPVLLPTSFPNILVSENSGIAVGMASMICGFNLNEVCDATINFIKDSSYNLFLSMPAPDFPTGGEIIYDKKEMEQIYSTGRGSFKVRAKWRYVNKENIIEIFEIPYTTTTDIIIDKIASLVKEGKLKEISDIRDETDLNGLKIAIDLKRGTDPEKFMSKLFKMTTLQDSFPCNFNILIAGNPKVMGIKEIMQEWISWRTESIRRMAYYDLQKKKDKLHLLCGLESIMLDLDKAIEIIRNTAYESEVVANLMMGFGIDQIQAEYVAEIKLRNINREYIINRISERKAIEDDITALEELVSSNKKIQNIIIGDLKRINKNYQTPRKSAIIYSDEIVDFTEEDSKDNYAVQVFISCEGYLKKIPLNSLRLSGEQKFKEGDSLRFSFEASNSDEILLFTNKNKAYRSKLSEFDDSKASLLGTFLGSEYEFDPEEKIITALLPKSYKGYILFVYENGKIAKIALTSYATKSNRKKLVSVYSNISRIVNIIHAEEDVDLVITSSDNRMIVFNTSLIACKTSRTTGGINVFTTRTGRTVTHAELINTDIDHSYYRVRKIPATGRNIKNDNMTEKQLSLLD